MARRVIVSKSLPPVPRPYSYAVKAGGFVFTAGLLGVDTANVVVGATPGRPDVAAQTRRALESLTIALDALGVPFAHAAQVKAYLTDLRHRDAYNAVYRELVKAPWPARATVGAGLVRDHAVVEIEAIVPVAEPPEEIRAGGLAPSPNPLSPARRAGDVLFVSGQVARDARGDLVGRGDMRAQAEQALDNLGAVLAAAGFGFADVIKITGTVPDWYGFHRYNEIFMKYFTEPFPARATIQGPLGAEGALIEIEAVAARGPRRTVESEAPGVGHFALKRRADTVYVADLPGALAPHSHAVQVGDLVYLCGEVGYDASGRLVGPGDIRVQTRKTLDNLGLCLAALGGSMDDIVKTNVSLTDYRLVPGFNEEYATYFTPPYPARTTVVAGLAQDRMVIEIEAVAVLGASETAVAVTGPAA
jgi:2-iminobutanoate/2-iminopropanoate deaminase